MFDKLPYPPPPEHGWYADDDASPSSSAAVLARGATSEPWLEAPATSERPAVAQAREPADGGATEYAAPRGARGAERWDGTVLSSAFMQDGPRAPYLLTNPVTGQRIVVDMGVLLGRRPSQDIPDGAKSVRIVDPTRTVSRSHAALSFDRDGSLWLEDYGSLNGTAILDERGRTPVRGRPVELRAPAKISLGDQIFDLARG